MTRMPDFSADLGPVEGAAHRLEHRMGAFFHHHHDQPQPAAEAVPAPAQPSQPPQEEPMSLQAITDIEAAVKDAAAKFEQVDHDALAIVDAIQGNPAANEAFGILGVLTGLPAADFDTALKVLRMVLVAAGGQFPASIASDGQQA